MRTEKFLDFNGKKLTLVNSDGTFYIAIKPICDVLELNFNRQFQNIKKHQIFKQLFANLQTVGADKRSRTMVCSPEKFIYGWLLSINSSNEKLLQYQRECYEVYTITFI